MTRGTTTTATATAIATTTNKTLDTDLRNKFWKRKQLQLLSYGSFSFVAVGAAVVGDVVAVVGAAVVAVGAVVVAGVVAVAGAVAVAVIVPTGRPIMNSKNCTAIYNMMGGSLITNHQRNKRETIIFLSM